MDSCLRGFPPFTPSHASDGGIKYRIEVGLPGGGIMDKCCLTAGVISEVVGALSSEDTWPFIPDPREKKLEESKPYAAGMLKWPQVEQQLLE